MTRSTRITTREKIVDKDKARSLAEAVAEVCELPEGATSLLTMLVRDESVDARWLCGSELAFFWKYLLGHGLGVLCFDTDTTMAVPVWPVIEISQRTGQPSWWREFW
jgi:hypothetical protein